MLAGLTAGAYAVHRVMSSMPADGIAVSVPSWAGWLLIMPAFVAGQAHRGWGHGRSIRKGHFAAIVGGTVALASLLAFGMTLAASIR